MKKTIINVVSHLANLCYLNKPRVIVAACVTNKQQTQHLCSRYVCRNAIISILFDIFLYSNVTISSAHHII